MCLVMEEDMKVVMLTGEERAKLQALSALYNMQEAALKELQLYKRSLFERHFPEARDPFGKDWHFDETKTYIILE